MTYQGCDECTWRLPGKYVRCKWREYCRKGLGPWNGESWFELRDTTIDPVARWEAARGHVEDEERRESVGTGERKGVPTRGIRLRVTVDDEAVRKAMEGWPCTLPADDWPREESPTGKDEYDCGNCRHGAGGACKTVHEEPCKTCSATTSSPCWPYWTPRKPGS